MYARATRSVSIPAPVYCKNLLYRIVSLHSIARQTRILCVHEPEIILIQVNIGVDLIPTIRALEVASRPTRRCSTLLKYSRKDSNLSIKIRRRSCIFRLVLYLPQIDPLSNLFCYFSNSTIFHVVLTIFISVFIVPFCCIKKKVIPRHAVTQPLYCNT